MNYDREFFLAGKLLEQKTSSLSDVILQMSCTLLLYKTFPDSGFPYHDLLKCHLIRSSQPSDKQNPVYVLQK